MSLVRSAGVSFTWPHTSPMRRSTPLSRRLRSWRTSSAEMSAAASRLSATASSSAVAQVVHCLAIAEDYREGEDLAADLRIGTARQARVGLVPQCLSRWPLEEPDVRDAFPLDRFIESTQDRKLLLNLRCLGQQRKGFA